MAQLTATAIDGTMLPYLDLAQTLIYTGSLLTSITVTYPSQTSPSTTFTQTLSYTGQQLTGVSKWVPSA